jgi:glucosamine-6-phosphate deaminase
MEANYQSFSNRAAACLVECLQDVLANNPHAALAASSGRTPLGMFKCLREDHLLSVDWRRVVVFQMDEYEGVSPDNPKSMAYSLQSDFVEPLRINRFHRFYDSTGCLRIPLAEYEGLIREAGGFDVVCHGVGRNGHIGFNEPGSDWSSTARFVQLAQSTIQANFPDQERHMCPRFGLTLGLNYLSTARKCLLLLAGEGKATHLLSAN